MSSTRGAFTEPYGWVVLDKDGDQWGDMNYGGVPAKILTHRQAEKLSHDFPEDGLFTAIPLYRQPLGFTREEVKAVRQMLDHAERWIDYRWLGEWTEHKMAWGVVEKLEATLPPETP